MRSFPRTSPLAATCLAAFLALSAVAPSRALEVVPATSTASAASAAMAPASAASGPAAVRAKALPLVALVLQPLIDLFKDDVKEGVKGLYGRLVGSATAALKPAEPARLVPALAFSIQQLDPVTYAVQRTLPMGDGPQTLHTKDVFAIVFASNVPGQIRLENIDGSGKVSKLGLYTVMAGQNNRVPRNKGIQLVGDPGTETFKFYFAPCVPQAAASQPGMETFKDRLPACSPGLQQTLVATSQPGPRAKSAVNLDLGDQDPDLAISAVNDFQPNDVVLTQLTLQHVH